MKNLFVLLIIGLLPLTSNSQGIQFFDSSSWENVLKEAKKSDKLIFFDAFATWCGPCKMMSSKVFPQDKVGAFYNENFINVKIDMEKGEGIDLAKLYKVRAYPTLLFVNGDGELVHSAVGYRDADELIELGKVAINPETQFAALQKRYELGERDPEFIRKYALDLADKYDSNAANVAEEYMAMQNDWKRPENIQFLSNFVGGNPDSKINSYFLANKDVFVNHIGKEYVDQATMQLAISELRATNMNLSETDFNAILDKYFNEGNSVAKTNIKLMYYKNKGQKDKAISLIKSEGYEFAKGNPMALNQHAWYFYENTDNKSDLKKAVSWVDEALNEQRIYSILDTKAALLFKLGKTKKAMKTANEAIALAQANGEDYNDTVNLINQWVKK